MIKSYFLKRIFDVLFSSIIFTLILPFLILISIVIVIFDPGPIFFKQKRVGLFEQSFIIYKFRSMPQGSTNLPSNEISNIKLSPIGSFIRRLNIDELPQLINIIRGEMSIVGPRPSLIMQKDLIDIRKKNLSLNLRPGLTGLAQIKSFDGMSVEEKAYFDGIYYKKISFIFDLLIILKTFKYLLKKPPKY